MPMKIAIHCGLTLLLLIAPAYAQHMMISQSAPLGGAQSKTAAPKIYTLPSGSVTRMVSPNKVWTLIFECPDYSQPRTLSIERIGTKDRKEVKHYERSVDVGWSPNSRLFFVNDNFGSNGASAYVYDPLTLKETDLAELILAKYHDADDYVGAGHSYLRVKRWMNSHQLTVTLNGHFDDPPPARGFAMAYRVDVRTGEVSRLYRHIYN